MDVLEPNDSQLETGHHLREHTEKWRANVGGPENITTQVRAVLDYISNIGLDLSIFLDVVCWGNNHLVADSKVRYK